MSFEAYLFVQHGSRAMGNLLEVRKLILVGCGDGDDFGSRWKVLSNTARIATVLVESNKLWNFIVLVDQVDRQSRVVVQRVCCTVLSHHRHTMTTDVT